MASFHGAEASGIGFKFIYNRNLQKSFHLNFKYAIFMCMAHGGRHMETENRIPVLHHRIASR